MKQTFFVGLLFATCLCWGSSRAELDRAQAEYYVSAYAEHYHVAVALVRSIVQQESGWHVCAVSPKGAVGLMQLMPQTAERLGVRNRCDANQNISGGVRYLAWLIRKFKGDFRLAVAAYYAGENAIAHKGLRYGNPDVITYVAQVQRLFDQHNRVALAGE